jgi:gliding motility-associated lipoprotein GldD
MMLFSGVVLLLACDDEATLSFAAKPRGYFRITLPTPAYQQFQSDCPFEFKHSKIAKMVVATGPRAQKCWYNLEYPGLKATVYLSYKPINKKEDLEQALADSYKITFKHTLRAQGIQESRINKPQERVYGLLYDVAGNSASNFQFVLTDSAQHFLHGSLYFYAAPNADSIKPVSDYITRDLGILIDSFRWK